MVQFIDNVTYVQYIESTGVERNLAKNSVTVRKLNSSQISLYEQRLQKDFDIIEYSDVTVPTSSDIDDLVAQLNVMFFQSYSSNITIAGDRGNVVVSDGNGNLESRDELNIDYPNNSLNVNVLAGYDQDYSSSYNNRSIPDVEYVNSKTVDAYIYEPSIFDDTAAFEMFCQKAIDDGVSSVFVKNNGNELQITNPSSSSPINFVNINDICDGNGNSTVFKIVHTGSTITLSTPSINGFILQAQTGGFGASINFSNGNHFINKIDSQGNNNTGQLNFQQSNVWVKVIAHTGGGTGFSKISFSSRTEGVVGVVTLPSSSRIEAGSFSSIRIKQLISGMLDVGGNNDPAIVFIGRVYGTASVRVQSEKSQLFIDDDSRITLDNTSGKYYTPFNDAYRTGTLTFEPSTDVTSLKINQIVGQSSNPFEIFDDVGNSKFQITPETNLVINSTGLPSSLYTYRTDGAGLGIGAGLGAAFMRYDSSGFIIFQSQPRADLNLRNSLNTSNKFMISNTLIETYVDFEIDGSSNGLILTSPDGTRWRLQVDNSGNLTTTSI